MPEKLDPSWQQGIPIVVAQPAYPPPQYAQTQFGTQQAQYGVQQPQYGMQQPQPVFVQNPHPQQVAEAPRPPPRGYWGSNICDWPRNIFPSCFCACCCLHGVWIIGQMSEKTRFASFRTVFAGYVCLWIIVIAVSFASLMDISVWLPFLFMVCVNIGLRLHIVRTKGITECGSQADGFSNLCGECCCALWCLPCAVAQQARFLYGYSRVFDGDSRIDRPDAYVEQV